MQVLFLIEFYQYIPKHMNPHIAQLSLVMKVHNMKTSTNGIDKCKIQICHGM